MQNRIHEGMELVIAVGVYVGTVEYMDGDCIKLKINRNAQIEEQHNEGGESVTAKQQNSDIDPVDTHIPTHRLLKIADVCKLTGLSRSTIYREIERKHFPQAIRYSAGCVRWFEREVIDWMISAPRV